jgi:hypothetical protein
MLAQGRDRTVRCARPVSESKRPAAAVPTHSFFNVRAIRSGDLYLAVNVEVRSALDRSDSNSDQVPIVSGSVTTGHETTSATCCQTRREAPNLANSTA